MCRLQSWLSQWCRMVDSYLRRGSVVVFLFFITKRTFFRVCFTVTSFSVIDFGFVLLNLRILWAKVFLAIGSEVAVSPATKSKVLANFDTFVHFLSRNLQNVLKTKQDINIHIVIIIIYLFIYNPYYQSLCL